MSDAETDARIDARADARHDAGPVARFGGLTPAEAAQRRWAQERAGQAGMDAGNEEDAPSDARIISALRRKAARGDASAARELREWREAETEIRGDAWMELLDDRELRVVRAIVDRAIARGDKTPSRGA
jgi:hypothetical protein